MTPLEKLDKLKAISRACNSSRSFEEFIVNLDLINMPLDEAERLYEDNCKEIIRHMSAFWLKNRRFKFYRVFDDHPQYHEYSIRRFALPYRLWTGLDKDYGNVVKLSIVAVHGEDELCANYDSMEDIQALRRIDMFHEIVFTVMIDLAKNAGLERIYGY